MMEPGRELDALIAEKVMGIEPWPIQNPCWGVKAFKAKFVPYGQEAKPCEAPSYSTDIAAAWKVVEKLQEYNPFWEEDGWLSFQLSPAVGVNSKEWYANFGDSTTGAYGKTAPHAICLAALEAVQ